MISSAACTASAASPPPNSPPASAPSTPSPPASSALLCFTPLDPFPPRHGVDIIWILCHTVGVKWAVEIADEFKPEFDALGHAARTEVLALARVLQAVLPPLGRP